MNRLFESPLSFSEKTKNPFRGLTPVTKRFSKNNIFACQPETVVGTSLLGHPVKSGLEFGRYHFIGIYRQDPILFCQTHRIIFLLGKVVKRSWMNLLRKLFGGFYRRIQAPAIDHDQLVNPPE